VPALLRDPLARAILVGARRVAEERGHARVEPLHCLVCAAREVGLEHLWPGVDGARMLARAEKALRRAPSGGAPAPFSATTFALFRCDEETAGAPRTVGARDLLRPFVVDPVVREDPLTATLSRLSPYARSLVALAQTLADERGHEEALPVHLFAVAVSRPEIAAAFRSVSVDPEAVVACAAAAMASLASRADEEPTLSDALLGIVERAEAKVVRPDPVSAAALFMAMLDQPDGALGEIARALGVAAGSWSTRPFHEPHWSTRDVLPQDGYSALAKRLLAGAQVAADRRRHARVEPAHLLWSAARHPRAAAALATAAVDLDLLTRWTAAELEGLPKGPSASVSSATRLLLSRAEAIATPPGKVRAADLLRALADEGVGPAPRILVASGFDARALTLEASDDAAAP
jgi:hypothetical protein